MTLWQYYMILWLYEGRRQKGPNLHKTYFFICKYILGPHMSWRCSWMGLVFFKVIELITVLYVAFHRAFQQNDLSVNNIDTGLQRLLSSQFLKTSERMVFQKMFITNLLHSVLSLLNLIQAQQWITDLSSTVTQTQHQQDFKSRTVDDNTPPLHTHILSCPFHCVLAG